METIEVKKIEYFRRKQIRGLPRFGCALRFYRITKSDDTIIGLQQTCCTLSTLDLKCFDKIDEKSSSFSPITKEKNMTFDDFLLETHEHEQENYRRKYTFIDCTDQS